MVSKKQTKFSFWAAIFEQFSYRVTYTIQKPDTIGINKYYCESSIKEQELVWLLYIFI